MSFIDWVQIFVIFGVVTLVLSVGLARLILWIRKKYGEE